MPVALLLVVILRHAALVAKGKESWKNQSSLLKIRFKTVTSVIFYLPKQITQAALYHWGTKYNSMAERGLVVFSTVENT